MSKQPEPPACIAKALRDVEETIAHSRAFNELHTEFGAAIFRARAVWDALLAEGVLSHNPGDPNRGRALVIPLPVVEARDTEQA